MADIESKIAKIWCVIARNKGCDECTAKGCPFKENLDATLALIAADRVCKRCFKAYDAHSLCPICQVRITDDAFDKGFETGKTEGQIEAARDRAGLVDLLDKARFEIAFDQKNGYPSYTAPDTLKQIDSGLKVCTNEGAQEICLHITPSEEDCAGCPDFKAPQPSPEPMQLINAGVMSKYKYIVNIGNTKESTERYNELRRKVLGYFRSEKKKRKEPEFGGSNPCPHCNHTPCLGEFDSSDCD